MNTSEQIVFDAVKTALAAQPEMAGIVIFQPYDYGMATDRQTPDLWAVIQVTTANRIGDEFAEFSVNIYCCSKFDADPDKSEVGTLRDAAVRILTDRAALGVDGVILQSVSAPELSGEENILTVTANIYNQWRN